MKIYSILTKLSRKKIGDLSPLPKMREEGQTFFEFYADVDLSMRSNKRLRKNNRSGYIKDISKEASSLVSREKRPDRSEGRVDEKPPA